MSEDDKFTLVMIWFAVVGLTLFSMDFLDFALGRAKKRMWFVAIFSAIVLLSLYF